MKLRILVSGLLKWPSLSAKLPGFHSVFAVDGQLQGSVLIEY